jgi:flagellar protein FlaG
MSNVSSLSSAGSQNAAALVRPAAEAPRRAESGSNSQVVAAAQAAVEKPRPVPSVHESAQISRQMVEAAAAKIQQFATSMNRDLDIRFDANSKTTTVVVTDPRSHEVIRQIPAPEVVELGRTIDYLSSLLVNQKA